MKKILLAVFVIATMVSCKKGAPKDYASVSGKITTPNSDSLVIRSRNFSRTIRLNQDGTFKDTMKVEKGIYQLFDGAETTNLFLENGADIQISLDAKEFDESVTYKGIGSETSNYLAKKSLFIENEIGNPADLFVLDKKEFDTKMASIKSSLGNLLDMQGVDSLVAVTESANNVRMFTYFNKNYQTQHNAATLLAKGKPSPKFVAYENFKGGKTSLDDLKGNYVYIDVWATWCRPCLGEIPALQTIEKAYHGKKIKFVSLSVDNVDGKRGSYEKWKKMVADKKLGGIQLYAPKDFRSEFVQKYGVNSIPRFILIDPQGNIVNANAPRPSNPKLKELFTSLGI